MSLIQVSNLSFTHEGNYDPLFEEVSFQIDTNWKLGFIGRNGKGKTTFLQLLMKEYDYQGRITASVEFSYFPFQVSDPTQFVIDIIEEVTPNYEYWQLQKELNLLQVEEEALYRPYDTLSGGEQVKVQLAALFLRPNHFLLIDEPTNHLDLQARTIVSQYLNRQKGFILVSHDRAFLDACIDHVLSINRTTIEVQKGNYASWQENKDRMDTFELAENDRLKKEMRQLERSMKQTQQWSEKAHRESTQKKPGQEVKMGLKESRRAKAKRMDQQVKSTEKSHQRKVEEKGKLLKDIEQVAALQLHPLEFPKQTCVRVQNLVVSYDGEPIMQPCSFEIQRGDRISLSGPNGSGKSSIMKLLLGEPISYQGELFQSSGLKVSYVPQDCNHLSGDLCNFIQKHGLEESLFRTVLRKLDFSREQFMIPLDSYSQGQKKKVMIAKSLCERAHLYLWDEPLNYIDVLSRMQIEKLLENKKITILFIEHDQIFVQSIATKRISLE